MAAILKTLAKRSNHHRSLNNLFRTPQPMIARTPQPMIGTHLLHQSTPLAHHLPRDPSIPYNPRWKPNPLFPPGTYKKVYEEMKAGAKKISGYLSFVRDIYDKVLKVFGPIITTMAVILFFKSKELDQQMRQENRRTKKLLFRAIEEFKASTALEKKKEKEVFEKKEEVVNEILKMEGIRVGDKKRAIMKIVENEVTMLVFLAATTEVKKDMVKAILDGEV